MDKHVVQQAQVVNVKRQVKKANWACGSGNDCVVEVVGFVVVVRKKVDPTSCGSLVIPLLDRETESRLEAPIPSTANELGP